MLVHNFENKTPPYYSLNTYLMETYGQKFYKVSLDAGCTCPNRDGLIDTRGCIFCSAGGSGDFAVPVDSIEQGIEKIKSKTSSGTYIGYFQSYSNTYGDPHTLDASYRKVLMRPDIAGISIATRPDCLGDEILMLMQKLKSDYPDKFIWIELGLQTIHEKTANYIRRGYRLEIFEQAMKKLCTLDIPVIAHIILGLPGETKEDILRTIDYINQSKVWGVKLQLLHILSDTDLYHDYQAGLFEALDKETYLDWLCTCITHLRSDLVLHRVTGDGPKKLLIAPQFSANKKDVLNSLHRKMQTEHLYQGKHYKPTKEI